METRVKLYIFSDAAARRRPSDERVRAVARTIAEGTDTDGLVVSCYLMCRRLRWEAHAMIGLLPARRFAPSRGKWAFTRTFDAPRDLPDRFHIIRMGFGLRQRYPDSFDDIHGWRLHCENFEAHLAYTFAHELHHHRRYNLGMHPREGEQAACRWAVERARELGYGLAGRKLPVRRRKPGRSTVVSTPHYEALRALPAGTPLTIVRDSGRSRYVGQTVLKVRSLRRNSHRMAVRTADGREWHWPMQWLIAEGCEAAGGGHG